jgi:hypothetical protein
MKSFVGHFWRVRRDQLTKYRLKSSIGKISPTSPFDDELMNELGDKVIKTADLSQLLHRSNKCKCGKAFILLLPWFKQGKKFKHSFHYLVIKPSNLAYLKNPDSYQFGWTRDNCSGK